MKNEELRMKHGGSRVAHAPWRVFTFALALFSFFILHSSFFTSAARAEIVRIDIDDTIHPITTEYIGRAINYAAQTHAEALLIRLSTPGGLSDSTRDIIEKIVASPVPVVIWVAPSGARAASAGFFILESADVAAMAPGTNTGAAHPVLLGGGVPDKVMAEKIENDSAALMRSVVSKRGRNVEVAESAVRQSKSFTDQEALKDHLIDLVAANQDELLKQLDGRTITRFNGATVTLHTANQAVYDFPMTLKQRILAFLMNPNIAFIVLAIGLLAVYFEFNHPGAILPGVIGLFFIVLAVFALNILPVRFAALALILVSFVFFALEAHFVSHGVLTIAGIVSLTFGALLLVDGPIPQMRVSLWTALAVSLPLGAITSFLLTIALRARRNKIITGAQGLIGEVGVARTALTPEGKIFVHGELWDAVAPRTVDIGSSVRVTRINGLQLEVEPVPASVPARQLQS